MNFYVLYNEQPDRMRFVKNNRQRTNIGLRKQLYRSKFKNIAQALSKFFLLSDFLQFIYEMLLKDTVVRRSPKTFWHYLGEILKGLR